LGNQTGVFIGSGSDFNVIGGTTKGAGNLIAASSLDGVFIDSSSGNVIQGNLIGTDATGARALGNRNGLLFTASGNTIGGTAPGAGNLISGNLADGIGLPDASSNNVIQGNKIGTDITGTAALGNAGAGISTDGSSNQIGGADQNAGNLISGNLGDGIDLLAGFANVVQGNKIGTTVTGKSALANGGDGVVIDGSQNTVGGSTLGSGNVIAFNGGDGVFVDSGSGNLISGNSIFSNGGLGIDLNVANNANNSQQAPVITSAVLSNGTTTVQGTLTAAPNTTYTIELFANAAPDPSGFGEGQIFLGFITVTTDNSGAATFSTTLSGVFSGQFLTATATDPLTDTSEFSNALKVVR
jgi:hypothetical protein